MRIAFVVMLSSKIVLRDKEEGECARIVVMYSLRERIYPMCANADEDVDGGMDGLLGDGGEERRVVPVWWHCSWPKLGWRRRSFFGLVG